MITREHEDRAEIYTAGPGFTLELGSSAKLDSPFEWRTPESTADDDADRPHGDPNAD